MVLPVVVVVVLLLPAVVVALLLLPVVVVALLLLPVVVVVLLSSSLLSSWLSTVGADSTVMPSVFIAALAEPSFSLSASLTVDAVELCGTVMVAVMMTLAAVTVIVTSEASTPAASAMFCCRSEVSA